MRKRRKPSVGVKVKKKIKELSPRVRRNTGRAEGRDQGAWDKADVGETEVPLT